MSRWFRHYAGMMRDEKLVRVAIKSKQTIERVVWVWGAILESAAEIDDHGRYDLDAAEIAYFLRADEDDVGAVLTALADAGRVADGFVVKWGDRQFSSDRSNARVAAHRERKRAERGRGNAQEDEGNGDVTLHDRHGNAPETETELDTEGSGAKAPSPRAKRATTPACQMTEDWVPGPLPADVADLTALWPEGRLEREIANVRDYWITRKTKRPGWDLTLHNRIRDVHDRVMREASYGYDRSGSGPRSAGRPKDGAIAYLDRKLGLDQPPSAPDRHDACQGSGGGGRAIARTGSMW